jgi:hypothetical protein
MEMPDDSPSSSGCPTAGYYQQTFTASESGVSTFTAVSQNTSEVTVSPPSGSGTFTVTDQVAGNTATSILVSDGNGHTNSLPITFMYNVCLP